MLLCDALGVFRFFGPQEMAVIVSERVSSSSARWDDTFVGWSSTGSAVGLSRSAARCAEETLNFDAQSSVLTLKNKKKTMCQFQKLSRHRPRLHNPSHAESGWRPHAETQPKATPNEEKSHVHSGQMRLTVKTARLPACTCSAHAYNAHFAAQFVSSSCI